MAKRGSGEGSIYKRSDGRWAGVVDLGWLDGKRNRKSMYAKTRKEVQEKLNKALTSHQQGLPLPSDQLTVGQYLLTWLEHSAKPKVRLSTLESYEEIVRLHLEPDLGKVRLSKLTPMHVTKLINTKLSRGLSPRRVQYIHAVLRRSLTIAVKLDYVSRNVAKLADSPSTRQTEVVPLQIQEARRFLQVIQGDRLAALYTLAITTGLRQGEILGLCWSDINLTSGSITIRNSLQKHRGRYSLVEPKSTKSRRTLVLPGLAIEAIRVHKRRQLVERLRMPGEPNEFDLVFTTRAGTPINRHNLTRDFQALLRREDLPKLRFHDLRHTAASLLLAQNVQPRDIMEVLGHSQIGLTMNLYSHVMKPALQNAADRMDSILAG